MRKVAWILNCLLLLLCAASLLLSISRGPNPAALLLTVPFASVLAVLRFHPKLWFVVVSLLANALVVVLLGFFVFSALVNYTGNSGTLLLSSALVAFVLVCAFNVVFLLQQFRVAS